MNGETKNPRVWIAITRKRRRCVLVGLRGSMCKNPNTWNLFGGNIDAGETPEQAAARELFEETGIEVDPEDLEMIFIKDINGKRCYWFQVGGRKTDQAMARITAETVDFDQADLTWRGRDDLHYSLKEYLDFCQQSPSYMLGR